MLTKYLKGARLSLGVLRPGTDFSRYAGWVNDQDTTRYMAVGRFPVTTAALKTFVKGHAKNPDSLLLGIFLNRGGRHIGNISLYDIDWRNRHGEIGLFIGDKGSRGKGYAKEAIALLAGHAFGRLNLHKLYCGMIRGNEASRRAFLGLGFKEEGRLRQHFYLDGRYLDCHRLGLLRGEFVKRQPTSRQGR